MIQEIRGWEQSSQQTVGVWMCPRCGLKQEHWMGQGGRGHQKADQIFCCEKCAAGLTCSCKFFWELYSFPPRSFF